MAEPFLSEIRMMSFAFPPKGWAQCFGQAMPINQNQALFALLGTQFGGNGQTTFALPDLQKRVPMHRGTGHEAIGEAGGEVDHTITTAETPTHTHFVNVDGTAGSTNQPSPTVYLADSNPPNAWGPFSGPQPMNAGEIGNAGGSQPHENRMPYLVINFSIALQGIFPSRN
jgi:microcystin-dependent protein